MRPLLSALVVVFLVLTGTAYSQVLTQTLPAGLDSGAGGAGSAYPFNDVNGHKWQWHYDSAQFTATGPITITEVYIRTLSSAAVAAFNFPSVEIVMASTPTNYTVAATSTQAGHNATFANNLNPDATIVRPAAPWVATTPPPTGWMPLGMTTPFAYNPALGSDFIVQITKCGTITAWGTSIFGRSGTAGMNGGNRYGDISSCTSAAQTFNNDEYVPVVRIDYVPGSGTPQYQLNQGTAYLDVNGVNTGGYVPASAMLALSQVGTLNIAGILTGAPWELVIGSMPLVPRTGGGFVLSDGQILNLNLTDPSLLLFWNGFASPPFSVLAVPISSTTPAALSAQVAVLDSVMPSGVSLSQAMRLIVQ